MMRNRFLAMALAAAGLLLAATASTSCGDGGEEARRIGRENVQKEIEAGMGQLPYRLSRSMTLTDVCVDGDYVVYTVEMSRGFDVIRFTPESMAAARKAVLGAIGEKGRAFASGALGVRYRYVDVPTGAVKELVIEPSEIMETYSPEE